MKNFFIGYIVGATVAILVFYEDIHYQVTIEKSSDSEWVRSDKDYGDTVITEVKVLKHEGKIDTVYPTVYYKRIEL